MKSVNFKSSKDKEVEYSTGLGLDGSSFLMHNLNFFVFVSEIKSFFLSFRSKISDSESYVYGAAK